MANVLRNVVSKQRIRYKEKGFNLDLAYICENIIAMGYPADNYESMYRNPLGDVYKFLEDHHPNHYKIYNLCLERSYDTSKFHGRVAIFPFEDHNPPSIEMILGFCEDVDVWLKKDSLNVVAVHCKAGKGRTGTMICCYLVYSGKYITAEDALALYDEKRTKDRKGVTIPSQRRYVKYFSNLMKSDLQYEPRTLQFCQIRFSNATAIHSLGGTVHCSISVLLKKEQTNYYYLQHLQDFAIDFRKTNVLDINNPPLQVSGDIKVEISKTTKKVFHLWFNTFFVSQGSVIEGEGNNLKYVYTFQKFEIDDAHKDKAFPDDFKVELVFAAFDNYSNVSAGSRPTSDYRSSAQDPSTSQQVRTLQHDGSLGSGISSISDQKISTSTSGTGSFGVSRPDLSNGYDSRVESTERNNGIVHNVNNHHSSNNHMTENEVNDSTSISSLSPVQFATLPPTFMEQQQYAEQHQMANKKMYTQRSAVGGTDIIGVGERDIDSSCQPSTNRNINNSKNSINNSNNCTNLVNNSYNHNHSNSSSKTNSVSSQSSSSTVGDNEEDWESGESHAKQLENITFLLSNSSVTPPNFNPDPPATLAPTSDPLQHSPTLPNTSSYTVLPNSLRNSNNLNSATSNYSSNSNSNTSPSRNDTSNTTSNTSISSCSTRIVGDDDDDDNNERNDEEFKIKFRKSNSKRVDKPVVPPFATSTNTTKSLEFKDEDNSKTNSSITHEADETAAMPTSLSDRPKLMHLLMSPKSIQQKKKSLHKPIFKRKRSNKIVKVSNSSSSICPDNSFVSTSALATANTADAVAATTNLKLKIKLKKRKLKLSQKFQWLQSYFRSDPVDFCENFVQQTTTSMRRNSMTSVAGRSHKLSTTTTTTTPPTSPTVTLPPPVVNVEASCEKLNHAASAQSVSTSNASIATGDMCEDYYSSICDNQLSFSNSPCKSPRTMADMALSSISNVGGSSSVGHHDSSLSSSFVKNTAASAGSHLRERRETLPSCSNHSNGRRRNGNIVIVAAKPAKTHAIGFNVNSTRLASQDSFEISGDNDEEAVESPASIYYTPSSSCAAASSGEASDNTNSAFVFPQMPHNLQTSSANVEQEVSPDCKASGKPPAKYSLNLVIVKECPEPPSNYGDTNCSVDIDSDSSCKKQLSNDPASTSVYSNNSNSSSSPEMCTSERCSTNGSSTGCNCNQQPDARHLP